MAKRGRPPKPRTCHERPLFDRDPVPPPPVEPSGQDPAGPLPASPGADTPEANAPGAGGSERTKSLLGGGEIRPHYEDDAQVVLYTGEAADFLKSLPAGSVKLVVTSPPYNIGKRYEVRESIGTYLDEQDGLIDELGRVLSDDGSLCWQVGNYVEDGEIFPLDIFFYPLFKRRGFRLRNRVVWHFAHGLHASRRFSGRYETLLWFTKTDSYTFNLDAVRVPSKYPGKTHFKGPRRGEPSGNPLGKNPSDLWAFVAEEWDRGVWDIPNVKSNHPEKTVHPCQFPVELVERCVLALTNPGDRVLDPYSGVGSALIAGLKHGRRVLGSERDGQYAQIARERIRDLGSGALKVRPMGQPVHQPTGREKVARTPEQWRTTPSPS